MMTHPSPPAPKVVFRETENHQALFEARIAYEREVRPEPIDTVSLQDQVDVLLACARSRSDSSEIAMRVLRAAHKYEGAIDMLDLGRLTTREKVAAQALLIAGLWRSLPFRGIPMRPEDVELLFPD